MKKNLTIRKKSHKRKNKQNKDKKNDLKFLKNHFKTVVLFFFYLHFVRAGVHKIPSEEKQQVGILDKTVLWLGEFGLWLNGTNRQQFYYVFWDKRAWAFRPFGGSNHCNNLALGRPL